MEEELAPSSASRGRGVLPLPPRPGHNQPEPLPGGGDSRTKGIGFTAIPHHWAETAAQALFVGVFNPCHRAQSRAKGHFAEGICSHRGDTFYLLMYLRVRFLECRNSGGSSLQLPAWHGEYEHPKSLLSPAQVLEFWLSPSFGSPTL